MNDAIRFSSKPELHSPTLIVGWTMDAGRFGTRVTDYLIDHLGAQPFCEIEPAEFFSLAGVTIAKDIAYFPESRFYACPDKDLVVFRSTPPGFDWYRFLSLVLDVAQDFCHVKEVYTVGSMIALGPHSAPRQFFGTVSSAEMKETLRDYGLTREVDFETPPGGTPTLNSFFLWAAKRRNIPGANLWVPVPFYLISTEDPEAYRKPLEFFNHWLHLDVDLSQLDEQAKVQTERISQMRASLPEIDRVIGKLESGTRLSEGEGEKLAKEVEEFLREAAA